MILQLPAIFRRFIVLAPVAACGFATSCVGPVPVDASFIAQRNQKVAVITMEAPKATVHHVGNQGLLDMAVNHATSTGSRSQLESYPSQTKLNAVGDLFAKRLNGLGYKATHLTVHPPMKDFNPALAKPTSSKPIHGTGTYLNGYDAAIYISMGAVGRVKQVYAFIQLSRSNAIATLHGNMFATATQKRLWRSPLALTGPGVPVEGDSDQEVFRAIDASLQGSSTVLEIDFFSRF